MVRSDFVKSLFGLCLMLICWLPMNATVRGDVNNSNDVNISDVTELINLLLSNEGTDNPGADCNRDGVVNISDVTLLINYLLSHTWPEVYEPQYESITVGNVTFRLLLVEGGTFMMGGNANDSHARPWEFPVHEVTLSDYYIAEFEVTQALWKAVMGSYNNPSWFTSANSYANDFERPVEYINYSQVLSFITKIKQKTGENFRLPTEAEWEYAARGGKWSRGYYYIGGDDVEEVAWHKSNGGDITHAVGGKAPNELGIYDMGGNVEELCSDFWSEVYSSKPATNPTGPTSGTSHVARGGSWDQAYYVCRATSRHESNPAFLSAHTGFRLVLPKE